MAMNVCLEGKLLVFKKSHKSKEWENIWSWMEQFIKIGKKIEFYFIVCGEWWKRKVNFRMMFPFFSLTCGWYTTLRSIELISRLRLFKWRSMGSVTIHNVTTSPSSSKRAQTKEINCVSWSILSLHTLPPLLVKIRWTRYVLANIEPKARENPADSR